MSHGSAGTPLLIGVSLKMYFDPARSVAWSREVAGIVRGHRAVLDGAAEVFVLPSLPSLTAVLHELQGSSVAVGAQDLFWEDRGAVTGGISGADLWALGCRYAEVGHAERRRYFGEDDATVRRKLGAALRNGLVPVLCVGERTPGEVGAAAEECLARLDAALAGLEPEAAATPLVVAYEPEWAIGQQQPADPAHVAAVVSHLRARLDAQPWRHGARVIYGGTAGPGLLPRLGDAVQGLFLGRLAHDPEALGLILDDAIALRA